MTIDTPHGDDTPLDWTLSKPPTPPARRGGRGGPGATRALTGGVVRTLALSLLAVFLLAGCAAYRPTGAWGIEAENGFLYSCELRAGVAYCSCMLGYMELHATVQEAAYDSTTVSSGGGTPQYIQSGVNQCRLAIG
jgi:hypothetical protein